MALSSLERRILVVARLMIEGGKETFLCHAIKKAYLDEVADEEVLEAKGRLLDYIKSMLDGSMTLGTWLTAKFPQENWCFDYNLQRTIRVAWVSWILEEDFWIPHRILRKIRKKVKRS